MDTVLLEERRAGFILDLSKLMTQYFKSVSSDFGSEDTDAKFVEQVICRYFPVVQNEFTLNSIKEVVRSGICVPRNPHDDDFIGVFKESSLDFRRYHKYTRQRILVSWEVTDADCLEVRRLATDLVDEFKRLVELIGWMA